MKEKYIRERPGKKYTTYQIDVPYTDELGERQHYTESVRSCDYPNKAAALTAARLLRDRALRDMQLGSFRRQYPTVGSLFEKKFDVLPRSVKTRKKHSSRFDRALGHLADVPIDRITLADVQTSVNAYAEEHSQYETERVLTLWRQIYKTAAVLGYDVRDLTAAVVVPRSKVVIKPREERITPDEVETFLAYVLEYNPREKDRTLSLCVYYVLCIMYHTGCRPAEALALCKSDIHPDHITITKSIGSDSNRLDIVVPTKTADSVRSVPVSKELSPILSELLKWAKNERLFLLSDGSQLSINVFSDYILRVAKFRHVKFHSYMLRHLMASDLVRTQSQRVAKDILGHASESMTLSYARTDQTELMAAIEKRTQKNAENLPKNADIIRHYTALERWYLVYRFAITVRILSVNKPIF